MNDSELEKKLKAVRGPALTADYQEAFTRRVLSNLRSAPPTAMPLRCSRRPRLAWGIAWHLRKAADPDVLADAKLIQETLAMFPHRVRAIVRDERGIELVLSDGEDVPASPPIYVRICDGEKCASVVTFSGQEIQIAGRELTVLAEAGGGIILEGNQLAWSSSGGGASNRGLKIQAKLVETTLRPTL